jgi:hypothetical protein
MRSKTSTQKQTVRENFFLRLKNKKAIIFVLIINFLFNLLLFDAKLFTGGDNAVYICLAESLVSGNGYKDIYDPRNPPHTQYPFGLPLLIAPILYLFGHNYVLMKLLIVFFCSGVIFFLWKLLQTVSTPEITLATVLLTATNIYILQYSHWILTEIPYLFFSTLGIFLIEKNLRSKNIIHLLIGSFAIIYSYLIRPTGLALIIAGAVVLSLQKRYKYLLVYLGLAVVCLGPWFFRNAKIGGAALGLSQKMLMMRTVYNEEGGLLTFSELMDRVIANIKIYSFSIIPQSIFYKLSPSLFPLVALMLIVPAIFGFFKDIIRKISIIHIYFIIYLVMILPWHEYVSTERYFLPILPFFFYFMCIGLRAINERL